MDIHLRDLDNFDPRANDVPDGNDDLAEVTLALALGGAVYADTDGTLRVQNPER